jgi:hypothetical protein
MGAVVVRCPVCRGASQVGPEAVGLLVACPRCSEPFVAVEEAAPVASRSEPSPAPERPRPKRPRPAPRGTPRRSRGWAEPIAPPDSPVAAAAPDPHDHSDLAPGGLPLSVMIGFALVPFTIPLIWVAALLLTGQEPALSIATPASLALSASILCLAVVFTVDWSPATRLKGVLMLVGLAYFAGFSLFFLKKDMIDRAKQTFSPQGKWQVFQPADRGYQVKLPNPHPRAPQNDNPLPGWNLTCYRAVQENFLGPTALIVASGPDSSAALDHAWFESVEKIIGKAARGVATDPKELKILGRHPGRQWQVEIPERDAVRVVRVYRVDGKVYYLAAEGPDIDPEDEDNLAYTFFNSFEIMGK